MERFLVNLGELDNGNYPMKKRRFFVAIDFSKYKGKYVAIVGRRIVASGRDAERVWREAKRKYPEAQPELLKVSKGEALVMIVCE